jgi:hypothetical protein
LNRAKQLDNFFLGKEVDKRIFNAFIRKPLFDLFMELAAYKKRELKPYRKTRKRL